MLDNVDCLFRRFVRVAGPDAVGVSVYRPSGSQPLARRPQPTIELAADGSVVRGEPGPADSRIPHPGRWQATGVDELTLRWDDSAPDTVIQIVACDAERLELRVRSGSLG